MLQRWSCGVKSKSEPGVGVIGGRRLLERSPVERWVVMRAVSLGEAKAHTGAIFVPQVLFGLLVLTGCGLSHHGPHHDDTTSESKEPAITKQNNEAIDQCQKLYPGSHQKPASPRIKCFNDATLAYYSAFVDNPWSGQVRVFTDRMMAIGKKYDAGQFSETQFDFEKERAITDFTSQILQRPYSAAKVNAGPTQGSALSKQAAATVLPKQMTCVPTSNSVNCY